MHQIIFLLLLVVVGISSEKCKSMTANNCFRCLQHLEDKHCHFCDSKDGGKTHKCTGRPTRSKWFSGKQCPERDYNVRSTGLDCLLAGYPLPTNDHVFGGDPDFTSERHVSEHHNGHGMAVYKTKMVHPTTITQYEKDMDREHSIILVQMLKDGEKDVKHLEDIPLSETIDTWIDEHFTDAEVIKGDIKTKFSRTVLNGALILHAIRDSMKYPDVSEDHFFTIIPAFGQNKGITFPESADPLELVMGTLLRPNTLIRYEDNSYRLESTQVFTICNCDVEHQIFVHVLTSYMSASGEIAYQIKVFKKDCALGLSLIHISEPTRPY